ncbi:hypothetical protein NCC49_001897 [Naganishia albida]|nr:hypothetical protein NCC49_001897 [Naganishia albida]
MKRSRSSDGNLSGTSGSAKALPVITIPSSVPSSTINSPSDTTLRTPTTADRVPERPRVESVGSADSRGSLSDKSKNGVAVRAGRIPVPKLVDVGEGLQTAQGQNARSVSMPQAPPQPLVGNDAIQRSVSTNDFGNGSAGNTYHKRQSSSTSSVGAVVRPTLGQGQPSSFNAGGSSSTPPSLVVAASATSSPLAPVVSPERPTRTADVRTSVTKDKSDTPASKGGLKGRLQRALNKNSDKEKAGNPTISSPIGESRQGGLPPSGSAPGNLPQPLGTAGRSVSNPSQSLPQPASTSQPHPGLGNRRPSNSSFAPSFIEPLNGNAGKGKRNLFSMRNASTDNISIGSTVSSASMMIRKMGALGKLARRNSMAGISRIFKNKDDEDGIIVPEPKMVEDPSASGTKFKKKKKGLFGSKSQSANSTTDSASANIIGANGQTAEDLTPAAKLARQHTVRTKSEEARKAAAAARASRQLPPAAAYDQGAMQNAQRDESNQEVDDVDKVAAQLSQFSLSAETTADAPVDDDQYGDAPEMAEDYDGEFGAEDGSSVDGDDSDEEGEYVWGRSYRDRYAIPARGILKTGPGYGPQQWPRVRAISSENANYRQPGPLAKIPSHDPDHLDGKNNKHESNYDPFSQSFSPFESNIDREPLADRLNFPYTHPGLNLSAPVLSSMSLNLPGGGKPYRSATSPPVEKRNINWAPECAIYHTFHAEVYDRRSEPATCNRLTPQLAQQIKDELNGYKMEEMDVHPSSRIHTHFFNRPRRPFSDEQKWKITRSTTHNASIRGPNKRDIVEVAGNPEDGFCSPACAIRSRWYRSRLNVEPIWARPIVDAGDLEGFQMQLKAGRKVDSLPEEVDLLEDMEDKGEIAIENGQLRRIASADTPQRRPEEVRCGLSESPGSRTQPTHSRTTAPLPKTEIVAESREKPSSLMQRLEKTLSDLRIVEKSANTATNQASPTSKILSEPVQTQLHQASSVSVSASGLNQTSQSISQSSPTSHEKANISGVESVDTVQDTQRPTQANTRPAQAEMGGDDSADEESEDDETRMVFELALAAREELDAGTF